MSRYAPRLLDVLLVLGLLDTFRVVAFLFLHHVRMCLHECEMLAGSRQPVQGERQMLESASFWRGTDDTRRGVFVHFYQNRFTLTVVDRQWVRAAQFVFDFALYWNVGGYRVDSSHGNLFVGVLCRGEYNLSLIHI